MNPARPLVSSIAMLGLAFVVAAPVVAQPPAAAGGAAPAGGQRQRGGARGAISLATISIAALDSIVSLKDDQKTKITDLQTTYRTDAQAAQGDQQKMRDVRTKANDDIKAVLTTDQSTKFTEFLPSITLLNRSGAVPTSVLAKVKLTDDQWTKIKAAAKEANDKINAIDRADRQAQSPPIVMAFKTTVDGLLTDVQKAEVAKAPQGRGPGAGGAAAGGTPPPAPK